MERIRTAVIGTGFMGRVHLEALRRIAVLSWHHGYSVPSNEVRAFLAAGYTPDQYELMVDSIGTALAGSRRAARVATAG